MTTHTETTATSPFAGATPGPWYDKSTGCGGQSLVIDETTGKSIAVAYDEKDARLIASAPALLSALLEARGALADAAHDLEYIGNQPWPKRSEGDKIVALNRARGCRSALSSADAALEGGSK